MPLYSMILLGSFLEDNGNRVGQSVIYADTDGDGVQSALLGAPNTGQFESWVNEPGAVCVWDWQPNSTFPVYVDEFSPADGTPGDAFGHSLATLGDLNNDGYDEVLVGAPGNDGAWADAGAAYLYWGTPDGLNTDDPDVIHAWDAVHYMRFGVTVSAAGDVNCDGVPDALVASESNLNFNGTGSVYVFLGSAGGLDQGVKLDATTPWSQGFGVSLTDAGDVDNAGCDDFVIGSANDEITLVLGDPDVSTLPASTQTVPWAGPPPASPQFGVSMAGVDYDQDSYGDVVVGAPGGSMVAVLYGHPGGLLGGDVDYIQIPGASGLGRAVAVGQVDGDGAPDLLLSSYDRAWVYYGQGWDELSEPDGGYFDGTHLYGHSVALGDWDGDGLDDPVVGAPLAGAWILGLGANYTGVGVAYPGVGCQELTPFFQDADGDGFGDVSVEHLGCNPSPGWVADNTDCDDGDPDAFEFVEQWPDQDGDGFGCETCSSELECGVAPGFSLDATDCDDANPDTFPGAFEISYDGVDANCDGQDNPTTCGGSCSTGPGRSGWALALVFVLGLALRRRGGRAC